MNLINFNTRQEWIMRKAIDTFGNANQTVKAMEEMTELQKELCKMLTGKDASLENIEEEVADVIITVYQIMLIYCDQSNVAQIVVDKLNRLLQLTERKPTMVLNPDKKRRQEIERAIAENDGYCPCRVTKNADTFCPCSDFLERNECFCGLYVKGGKN